jgi:hypothetical protein
VRVAWHDDAGVKFEAIFGSLFHEHIEEEL